MKKQLFSFLCAGLMLTACGQQHHHRSEDRPLAAHLLSLPERQCPRASDEDAREVFQLRGED